MARESDSDLILFFPDDDFRSDLPPGVVGLRDWSLAVRYHDFKSGIRSATLREAVRAEVIGAVLNRAREVLGPLAVPTRNLVVPLEEHTRDVVDEIDLETTLEEADDFENLKPWGETRVASPRPVVLCLDTSLSMTGEKLAVAAVALGVVLLQFSEDPIGVIAFESEPSILKRADEKPPLSEVLARFLDVPAQGYTDLEAALKTAARLCQEVSGASRSPTAAILVTDGKYTAGRDPGFLGSEFSHLEVLKMGGEESGASLCAELARRGNGSVRVVQELEDLPRVMYQVVKNLRRQSKNSIHRAD